MEVDGRVGIRRLLPGISIEDLSDEVTFLRSIGLGNEPVDHRCLVKKYASPMQIKNQ